jgi:hypothetical protein
VNYWLSYIFFYPNQLDILLSEINYFSLPMNSKILTAFIVLVLGASYLAIDSAPFNLKKQVNPPNYNITISQRYAAFAKIAYCPKNLVQNWSCKDCKTHSEIKDLHIISGTKRDVFGYAFYDTLL